MGVIKECGGKMWMGEREKNSQHTSFYHLLISILQANGIEQAKISLSRSATTTKLVRHKESKSSNILS
jgi:hypothetical protein